MPPVVVNQAEEDALTGLVGVNGTNAHLRLARTFHDPLVTDTPNDYAEAQFPGYAAAVGNWTGPADDGTGNRVMMSPAVVWTRAAGGAGDQIYGWFLTQGVYPDWILIAASMFSVPRPMDTQGMTLPLQVALICRRG